MTDFESQLLLIDECIAEKKFDVALRLLLPLRLQFGVTWPGTRHLPCPDGSITHASARFGG